MQQQADVFGGIRRLIEQAQLHQVFGRDGKRDGVAHRLVETVVGAVAECRRKRAVGALVEVMAQFVVDGQEVLARNLDAHLQPHIAQLRRYPTRWHGTPPRGPWA